MTAVELRRFVGEAVGALLDEPRFLDALPGYLLPDAANQARIVQLLGNCALQYVPVSFLTLSATCSNIDSLLASGQFSFLHPFTVKSVAVHSDSSLPCNESITLPAHQSRELFLQQSFAVRSSTLIY